MYEGKIVEALHDPAAEVCILPEYLLDTLVGNKPLTPTNKYFKSPSGLFFECRGIARDMPIIGDKIEMHLDFYIYDILDFDLLLGYPLDKFLISHQGSLDEKLRETASATTTSCSENSMVEHFPEQNMVDNMMHTPPFAPSELVLLDNAESSQGHDSEDSLHYCEDE